jgi:serine/threonine-protein kinase
VEGAGLAIYIQPLEIMENTEINPRDGAPAAASQFRPAIILPDGRRQMPLGSGMITSMLGEGGMANVYEIWNSELEVFRAVKLLLPNCSEESKLRFQTEIKITAKLHHPNIIEIHGVGSWNGLPLIEMERIDGFTLENLVFDRGALPVCACTAIGIMIARSLAYAHNQTYVIYGKQYHGVIHRDLKPSNIMVCKDGIVKLMDFGIARPTDASIHTTDGSILGTMQYLSPEQLEGKEPDVRTDIYSLGTTLYEAVSGMQAFPEHNISKLMMNKIKNEYRPLDEFEIALPPRLKKLIHKCMVHDREKRPESAALLLAELEKIHRSFTDEQPEQVMKQLVGSSLTEKIVVSSRRRLPLIQIGAGVAIAAILLPAALMLAHMRRAPAAAARQSVQLPTPAQTAASPSQGPAPRAAPPEAARTPGPLKPKFKTFAQTLIEKHGTNDLLDILVTEFTSGNFLNASNLYKELPAQQANSPKALIYEMRTLSTLGRSAELAQFLSRCTLDDGEILLEKAKAAFGRGNISDAQQLLDASLKSPRQFMDSDNLRQEVYYYRAQCATAVFDAVPSEASYKNALGAWWQVRNELRSSPNHRYNQKAVSETQRIAEKFHATKG